MGEPVIRVRVIGATDAITITSPTKVQVQSVTRPESRHLLSTPLTIRRIGDAWQVPGATPPPFVRDELQIKAVGPDPLRVNGTAYPGTIHLVAVPNEDKPSMFDRMDVVNHVNLEAYLPGVLDRELYDHWHASAFVAQAIAARSFAIDRIINDGPGRHFDVEATEASQAYSGKTAQANALRAVADSTGLVLTWKGDILPAYYSSSCGGIGQSPQDAFGAQPGLNVPAPLQPGRPHDWCSHSKQYQWGPITRDRKDLSRRLAAWGRAYRSPLANLGQVTAIRTAESNSLGRPVRYLISDDKGRVYSLRAESLRHACNYANAEAKLDPPKQKLYSSFLNATVDGDSVIFRGRGYGHGVGLCQYGAEGMARAGYDPVQILEASYPGAKIERAY